MAFDVTNIGTQYINDLTVQTLRGLPVCIVNSMVNAAAAIASSKLVNRICPTYQVADGTNVAATGGDGVPVYICTKVGGATLKGVHVICPDAPSGGDLKFTVDIKKASAGVAPATMLTAPIDYANGTVDYTVKSDVAPAVTAIANGDTILVIVTVSGTTGAQGQGLCVWLDIDEAGS